MQYNEVKELISIFESTDLTEMELNLDNAYIRLNRGAAKQTQGTSVQTPQPVSTPVAPVAAPVVSAKEEAPVAAEQPKVASEAEGTVITAPLVGTFYSSPAPDQAPFVKVGDMVAEGDVVCIIEAMKFMNEVNSKVSGKVAEVLVEDGALVEYGQPLIRIV